MADDFLQRGARLIERVRKDKLAHAVTYTPLGGSAISLDATTDGTDFEIVTEGGLSMVERSRDFLLAAEDLVVDSEPYTPKVGDRIKETVDGVGVDYEVKDFGSSPHFRLDDTLNLRLRVHTRRIGVSA